ncbi:hypothetical protein [Commensalibacter communis]|uniref:Uncharacterized protein n=1 Tax=Commensalibacter communis TaxID=2972786 RepID=A0A9W4TPN6_9PROT|nr:hypothetical protein [Commensalibacter communis]CAI3933775.1 unnamed protein product [Commensalibacter communis]CAI3942109.1 unnamed protein product [Commensalibacter communis]CAI3944429.1 unnamed protein product [Commensalibacter communis]CAI3944543.1 unnamed protein product [Commensalibacter communis]CAI3960504.1 unnamed protein product [Commensalibacter communis]
MTKIENNGQIVKKEVFKLTLEYPIHIINLENLSQNAIMLAKELVFLVGMGRTSVALGNKQLKEINLIEYDYFYTKHVARATDYIFTLESLRKAAQELEEKGYLTRDTDGTLAFAQKEAA